MAAAHDGRVSPAEHLIDNANLFNKAQRMIERDNISHRAYANVFRACASANAEQ